MFTNIGGKIQMLAKIFCWVGIVGSVLGGLLFTVEAYDEDMIVLGLAIALIGSLFSWIGSFMMIGFGKMVQAAEAFLADKETETDLRG